MLPAGGKCNPLRIVRGSRKLRRAPFPRLCPAGLVPNHCGLSMTNPDQFWTSEDGQILAIRNKDKRTVTLTLAFWPRHPVEFDFLKTHLAELKFSERSSLARI